MKVYTPNKEDYTYPDEMEKILDYLSKHGKIHVSGKTIERLYEDFSDTRYCAGWMCVSNELLEEFADWLSEVDY